MECTRSNDSKPRVCLVSISLECFGRSGLSAVVFLASACVDQSEAVSGV